jgi:hypothetical protein
MEYRHKTAKLPSILKCSLKCQTIIAQSFPYEELGRYRPSLSKEGRYVVVLEWEANLNREERRTVACEVDGAFKP